MAKKKTFRIKKKKLALQIIVWIIIVALLGTVFLPAFLG